MFRKHSPGARRNIAALLREYLGDRLSLEESELLQVVDHADRFFAGLPLRFRLIIGLILQAFAFSALFVPPLGRSFGRKPLAAQKRVYLLWVGGRSYLAYLLRQMLHAAFLGSLYTHPRVLASIGYQKQRRMDAADLGEEPA